MSAKKAFPLYCGALCRIDSGLLAGASVKIIRRLPSGDFTLQLLVAHGAWKAGDKVQLSQHELAALSTGTLRQQRAAKVQAQLLHWEKRLRAAQNKVKQLRKKARYYARQIAI